MKLFADTIKYLRFKQVYYRFYYFIKKKVYLKGSKKLLPSNYKPIICNKVINNLKTFEKNKLTFNFLNTPHSFRTKIDWNYNKYGKLWAYNLNYFDFLNQKKISKDDGLFLINDFINNKDSLKEANEPYPISLRCINWVKFLSKNMIRNSKIDKVLFSDFNYLSKNLEYNILGNHLLENAFSLLFGAYYFQNQKLYQKAKKLLKVELDEQILKDGAHFELSPMYHQTLFFRILDCIYLIKLNRFFVVDDLFMFLNKKAVLMHSWLNNITYQNGDIPMVNDSTYKIAPRSSELFSFAKKIGVACQKLSLSDSGYRKISNNNYELFVDVGSIVADYQPAHTHSDTFNFELIKNKCPVFVDTGITTYEKNNKRQLERSTFSHNTVEINSKDQTQVWGGFRVGNRAKITSLEETDFRISASHSGYKAIGFLHQRIFEWSENEIVIKDILNKPSMNKAIAHFHFHYSIIKPIIKNEKVTLSDRKINISFVGCSEIKLSSYDLSLGFNKSKKAFKLIVRFDKKLKTSIDLSNE